MARTLSRTLLGAVLVVGLALHAPPVRADGAETEARTHFVAGVNLLRDPAKPRYEEAYREFKAAYAISPSYKILGNVALCAMKLERDEEAITAYERYLREAVDLDPAEREQIERDVLTLRAGLVTLVLDGVPAGGTLLDTRTPAQGAPITNVYGPVTGKTTLGVRRGHHVIRARAGSRGERTWEVDADRGPIEHVFSFEEAPAVTVAPGARPGPLADTAGPPRPVPAAVWAAGGATVALLGSALVVGAVASSKRSEFDGLNDGSDVRAAEDLRSEGRTLNVASDVLLVGAVVGAAVTTYLFLTRPAAKTPSSAAQLGTFPLVTRF